MKMINYFLFQVWRQPPPRTRPRTSTGLPSREIDPQNQPGELWSFTVILASHWSSSYNTALSLVESFPSDAGASNLAIKNQLVTSKG